jgi:hypothetical protein
MSKNQIPYILIAHVFLKLLNSYEKYFLKIFMLLDITPYSPLEVNQRFGPASRAGFLRRVFFNMKVEATRSTETSVGFQRTTRRYNPEYCRSYMGARGEDNGF